jgi:phosphoserine phosphatase RsbU/P
MIGDVCGTGAEAAAVTAEVRYTARALTRAGLSLEAVVQHINLALLERPADRFCTCVLGVLEPEAGGSVRLQFVNAGHPQPILRSAGSGTQLVAAGGRLLGVRPDVRATETAVRLEPGDGLTLYTDGVTEARRAGQLFGESRLVTIVAGLDDDAATTASRIEHAAEAFAADAVVDDIAVLVIRAPHVA